MEKMKRVLSLFIFSVLIGGCQPKGNTGIVEGSGTLEIWEHAVGPRTAGKVTRLLVNEGDWVKNGQLLATLERYEQKERDFKRAQELLQNKAIPRTHYENAVLDFEDQQILSPVDGIILEKIHETGEVLSAGTPVFIVGDPKKIWVRLYVPGSQINLVQIGQPAEVKLDGLPDKSFKGKVTYIAFQAEFTPRNVQTQEERITQTYAVKVTLEPAEMLLRPGVPADVAIDVSSAK